MNNIKTIRRITLFKLSFILGAILLLVCNYVFIGTLMGVRYTSWGSKVFGVSMILGFVLLLAGAQGTFGLSARWIVLPLNKIGLFNDIIYLNGFVLKNSAIFKGVLEGHLTIKGSRKIIKSKQKTIKNMNAVFKSIEDKGYTEILLYSPNISLIKHLRKDFIKHDFIVRDLSDSDFNVVRLSFIKKLFYNFFINIGDPSKLDGFFISRKRALAHTGKLIPISGAG